jgi:hypothetical protein
VVFGGKDLDTEEGRFWKNLLLRLGADKYANIRNPMAPRCDSNSLFLKNEDAEFPAMLVEREWDVPLHVT